MNTEQNHNFYCFNSKKKTPRVMIEVDIKTYHGHLFTCNKCNKFHFEFNQIGINFSTLDALKDFENYLEKIDSDLFVKQNQDNSYVRKIHIPVEGSSIKLLLHPKDLEEIIVLITMFIDEYETELKDVKFIQKLTNIRKDQHN